MLRMTVPKYLYQRKQRRQAYLVILARDARLQILEGGLPPETLHHAARYRHLDSQEFIALAILPRPRLEKARQPRNLRRIGMGEHGGV